MNKSLLVRVSFLALICACGSPQPKGDDALRVAISLQDGDPVLGDNTVIAEILDANEQPMDAEVSLHIHMPAHGHSAENAPPIVVTRLGPGKYSLSPVRFTMPGDWKLHVRCSCPSGQGETEATFSVN